jgi:hypothetical protein
MCAACGRKAGYRQNPYRACCEAVPRVPFCAACSFLCRAFLFVPRAFDRTLGHAYMDKLPKDVIFAMPGPTCIVNFERYRDGSFFRNGRLYISARMQVTSEGVHSILGHLIEVCTRPREEVVKTILWSHAVSETKTRPESAIAVLCRLVALRGVCRFWRDSLDAEKMWDGSCFRDCGGSWIERALEREPRVSAAWPLRAFRPREAQAARAAGAQLFGCPSATDALAPLAGSYWAPDTSRLSWKDLDLENMQLVVGIYGLTAGDARARRALKVACGLGRLDVAQWLVRTFRLTAKDVRTGAYIALREAISGGHLGVVKWLLGTYAHRHERGFCIRYFGWGQGHREVAEWLEANWPRETAQTATRPKKVVTCFETKLPQGQFGGPL